MLHTECLVQTEFAHTVFFIKFCQGILHFLRGMVVAELLRQLADPAADALVVDLALLAGGFVVRKQGIFRYI